MHLSAYTTALSWTAAAFVVLRAFRFVYAYWRHTRSPLRMLSGPRDGAGWIAGHQRRILSGEGMKIHVDWVAQYGGTFVLRGFLGKYQLVTTDARALTHVLFATHVFHKAVAQRRQLRRIMGDGLLWSEDAQHRDQRRLISPAFGHVHVREMTSIFLEAGAKLCGIWHNGCVEADETARFDALEWISKATLDAIGKAGFDYEFNALDGHETRNELADSFNRLLRVNVTPQEQLRTFLIVQFPIIRALFPDRRLQEFDNNKRMMDEVGMRMVQGKKARILESGDALEKDALNGGNDLLSLLLKENLAKDLDSSQRISDAEVLAQIPTFIFAGHETTSNATTWALYELAIHPRVQDKLRAELQECGSEQPTLEALNAIPYLEQVVRETLRFHPTITFLTREAICDDVVPLKTAILDGSGTTISQIRVQQGDNVIVPIWLVNRSKDIWGPDADQFRPERWEDIPAQATALPGITPGLLSFNGGPRSCIGHRFAVAEMKALLFHIVRQFEVSLAVDKAEIWTRTSQVMRPQLRSDNSVQLPVLLKPVQ